jgi:hypothetical protein
MRLTGLPAQVWEGTGEVGHVVTRTAGDLEHLSLRRKYATENFEDWPLVLLGRRAVPQVWCETHVELSWQAAVVVGEAMPNVH